MRSDDVRDALKNYLALASGLTEVGRRRALAASKALVAQGEATAEQVGALAEELMEASRQNRELVAALVRGEVEKTVRRVGLATADEVQRLTHRLHDMEAKLRSRAAAEDRSAPATASSGAAKPAKKSGGAAPRKASGTKATKATATKASGTKATKATATKASATKSTARGRAR